MAAYFGQGATYDSIEGRFRAYRKTAKEMRDEVPRSQIPTTPRRRGPATPRTANGRVTKPSSSTKKQHKSLPADSETPTKKGKTNNANVAQAIVLDEDCDVTVKNEGYNPVRDMTDNTYGNGGPTTKREQGTCALKDKFCAVKEEQGPAKRKENAFRPNGNMMLGLGDPGVEWVGSTAMEFVAQDFTYLSGFGEFDDAA